MEAEPAAASTGDVSQRQRQRCGFTLYINISTSGVESRLGISCLGGILCLTVSVCRAVNYAAGAL